jgi:hypothetical protein
MRVTIIPSDGFVSVDNEGYNDLDLSFMDADIHALQWYDTDGEIEYQDARGRATHNVAITSLEQFEYWDQCYAAWQAAKDAAEQAAAQVQTLEPEQE